MQLNNKITGHSIRITNYSIDGNRVSFVEIDQSGKQVLSTKHNFKTITLADFLIVSTNYEELCYTTLKDELGYTDYIMESDTQNWLSLTKMLRFFIPASLIMEGLRTQNSFNDVMNNMIADSITDPEIIILTNTTFTTVYANSVSEANAGTITPLIESGVIIME